MSLVVFPGAVAISPGYSEDPARFGAQVTEERVRIVLALVTAARAAAAQLLEDLHLKPGQTTTIGGHLIEGIELRNPFIRIAEEAVV